MRSLDRKLVRDLWHMRGQVLAIILVVACGVAAFVSMRNIYRSLRGTQAAYYNDYRFADVFVSVKRAPEWVAERIGEIPGVATIQTRVVATVTLDVPGLAEPATGRLISIPERQSPMLNDLHLVQGRYIEAAHRDEVIVSAAFAEKNGFHPGDEISAIINGHWTRLRIVGVALSPEFVYEIPPGDMFPDSRRFGVMWMNRHALSAAFNLEGAFNDVAISLMQGAREEEVIRRLDSLLEPWGGLGAYGRDDQISNHFVSNEIAELQITSTVIPAIFLTVTAFLIHLVLSRLVNTQRDQIAVLKAFGYDNRAIGAHYLKLSLGAVSGGVMLGGIAGWYFGFNLTAMYADFFRFPVLRYEMDPWLIGTAMLISFGASSLGAMRAVRRAIALPPAEAMRPESPARFRPGFVERLGFQRLLPLSLRIIIRNLERNPIKALLNALVIAVSVSLLVDANFRVFKLPPEGLAMTVTLAKSLGVKPGDEITVEALEGTRPVRKVAVVGVVDEVLGLSVYMNRRALNRLMNEAEVISGLRLMVDEKSFPALYAQIKRTPAVSGVMLSGVTLQNFNETLARTMGTSTAIIIGFACIIVFGMVYNGARIALSERGRELASLRVLGFTKAEIGVMLLGEQAILTALAIPIGWATGYLLCFLIVSAIDTELMRLPLVVTGKTMATALLITALAAVLSGLLVQWRLRRLDLVEVLKTRE